MRGWRCRPTDESACAAVDLRSMAIRTAAGVSRCLLGIRQYLAAPFHGRQASQKSTDHHYKPCPTWGNVFNPRHCQDYRTLIPLAQGELKIDFSCWCWIGLTSGRTSGSMVSISPLRSLSHTMAVPKMYFWRKNFPELPEDELNTIFNYYSHVVPALMPKSQLIQTDAAQVPLDRFASMRQATVVDGYDGNLKKEEGFTLQQRYPDALILTGWAGWKSTPEFHKLGS